VDPGDPWKGKIFRDPQATSLPVELDGQLVEVRRAKKDVPTRQLPESLRFLSAGKPQL
jgi:hypothetical protein